MTDAELTILSLLAQGPRYGHEIQQIIDERGLRDWLAVGYASVYYILNKFERQNMVTSELRPSSAGTPRKRYTLTDAGQGILRTAIAELLRMPRSIGTGFELGLANLEVLAPAQVYLMLNDHRADLEAQLKATRQLWAEFQTSPSADNRHDLRALYTHSITRMEADLNWLNAFLNDWLERFPGVEKASQVKSTFVEDSHSATTARQLRTPPNPLKMLQRLQRPIEPKSSDEEQDD
ncbi:MAG: PadR family transcriptional regulator [Anaerolineae bacterium]